MVCGSKDGNVLMDAKVNSAGVPTENAELLMRLVICLNMVL